jgi:hypothetical protein
MNDLDYAMYWDSFSFRRPDLENQYQMCTLSGRSGLSTVELEMTNAINKIKYGDNDEQVSMTSARTLRGSLGTLGPSCLPLPPPSRPIG